MSETAVATTPDTLVGEDKKQYQVSDLIAALGNAEVGENCVNEYWAPEPGEEVRAILIGKTTMKNKQSVDQDAVKLVLEDGKTYLNADKVLVSSISRHPIPTAFLISFTGWTESKVGKYREFNINKLNLKLK